MDGLARMEGRRGRRRGGTTRALRHVPRSAQRGRHRDPPAWERVDGPCAADRVEGGSPRRARRRPRHRGDRHLGRVLRRRDVDPERTGRCSHCAPDRRCIVGALFQRPHGRYHGIVLEPIEVELERKSEPGRVESLTREVVSRMEDLIRREPGQWHLFQPNWPCRPGLPGTPGEPRRSTSRIAGRNGPGLRLR